MDSAENSAGILTARPLQVLVAEDNTINQIIILKLLEGVGHIVEIVENGQEACDAVTQGVFDLIIMDVHMPVRNGLEATKSIRTSGNSIPIIGCSADSFPDQVDSFLQVGMNDIVVKPVHRQSLLISINKVMDEEIHKSADGGTLKPIIQFPFT